jgi:predicted nucleic acid-binding protein
MIVVADTSPLNYLIRIGAIGVLPKLYGTVIIPPSVCEELSRHRAPELVRIWIATPPEWLSIETPTMAPDAELLAADLDAGEFDAILPAQELGATDLIVDDWQGRKEAERRHIPYIGTVGVLQLASKKGFSI